MPTSSRRTPRLQAPPLGAPNALFCCQDTLRCVVQHNCIPCAYKLVVHPEDEGRLTLQASEEELARLLASSAGGLTHALILTLALVLAQRQL